MAPRSPMKFPQTQQGPTSPNRSARAGAQQVTSGTPAIEEDPFATSEDAIPWPEAKPLESPGKPYKNLKG